MRHMLDRWGCLPNVCIEAARIGVDVAQAFGYIAEPVPVGVQVIAGDRAVVVPGPAGTPHRASDRGFNGHLVLLFAGGWFVDLTAPQFHRPDLGIHVTGPVVFGGLDRAVLQDALVEVHADTGVTVRYYELVGNVAWRSPRNLAWSTSPPAIAVQAVLADLRNRLEQTSVKTAGQRRAASKILTVKVS
jgi:hypothetical protein